jgi:hypothetical protein
LLGDENTERRAFDGNDGPDAIAARGVLEEPNGIAN